jgi:hypothetical protein
MRFSFASSLVAALLASASASAADRVLVSAKYGVDADGCGSVTAPCRTFAAAHTAVPAGGEIEVMDPGDYGPLHITKSISVTHVGPGTAGIYTAVDPGLGSITIDAAPTDKIVLTGLSIEVDQGTAGGVVLNSGGSLAITNCVFRNQSHGVSLLPTGILNFTITDSFFGDNVWNDVLIQPNGGAANGLINNVIASNVGGVGVQIEGSLAAAGAMKVDIIDSVFSGKPQALGGVIATSPPGVAVSVQIRNVTASGFVGTDTFNHATGFEAFGNVVLRVAHSQSVGNNWGFKTVAGGTIETYRDNNIRGNLLGDISGNVVAVGNR